MSNEPVAGKMGKNNGSVDGWLIPKRWQKRMELRQNYNKEPSIEEKLIGKLEKFGRTLLYCKFVYLE